MITVSATAPTEKIQKFFKAVADNVTPKERDRNKEAETGLFADRAQKRMVQQSSEPFPELPFISFRDENDHVSLLSMETALSTDWNPMLYGCDLDFRVSDTARRWAIDANKRNGIQYRQIGDGELELPLDMGSITGSIDPLVIWLSHEVHRDEVLATVMRRFIERCVLNLMDRQGISLDQLYVHKVELAEAIKRRLKINYEKAVQGAYEGKINLIEESPLLPEECIHYAFDPQYYRPRKIYDAGSEGREFTKHACAMIHDLRYRTEGGAITEEYRCATAIDANKDVKRWIRNIEKDDRAFWLPMKSQRFFPDFLVELSNGKVLVVEYKGDNLYSNDKSREERDIGALWEDLSKGKNYFMMAVRQDAQGRGVGAQIQAKIDAIMGDQENQSTQAKIQQN